jgi:hypothetical protein
MTRARRHQAGWAHTMAGLGCGLLLACGRETRGPVLFDDPANTASDAALNPSDAALNPSDAAPHASDAGCSECGARIALEDGWESALQGGDGGFAQRDLCPGDQVLIGYAGSVRNISSVSTPLNALAHLEGRCGTLTIAAPDVIRVTPADLLPERGDARATIEPFTRVCPPDQAIVGVSGRAGLAVDQLAFTCASFRVVSSSGALAVVAESALSAPGGPGGTAFSLRCPEGQVARGHSLRANRWLDAFALLCGTPRALAASKAAASGASAQTSERTAPRPAAP